MAHRAGNDLHRLAAAQAVGADFVEADVHVHRGRLEVRHLKALGPLPLLWDRWYVTDGRQPRLLLEDVLAAASPGTNLLLDLKGPSPRLVPLLRRMLAGRARESVTVCSRTWSHLRSARDGQTVIHSVGSRLQLARYSRLRTPGVAVAVNQALLDRRTVEELRRRVPTILAWGFATGRRRCAWSPTGSTA